MLFSPVPHPVSAMYLASGIGEKQGKTIILTDDRNTYTEITETGPYIFGKGIAPISHIGELFCVENLREDIILIHSSIFHESGNLEGIRRTHTLTLKRNEQYSQNTLIEKFLDLGYQQSDYRGEGGTYIRKGSIIRVNHDGTEYTIEYFDDTIESIVKNDSTGSRHLPELILPRLSGNKNLSQNPQEENTSKATLNTSLFHLIEPYRLILISCEFLRERDLLKNAEIYEYSSIRKNIGTDTLLIKEVRESSESPSRNISVPNPPLTAGVMGGLVSIPNSSLKEGAMGSPVPEYTLTIPQIETIGEFLDFLKLPPTPLIEGGTRRAGGVFIITRYGKKVREFLDMNGLSHIYVGEERQSIESFSLGGGHEYLSTHWKNLIKKDHFTIIGDDIIGKIFVQNRVRKSTIKHLDLLLTIKEGDHVVHREHGVGKFVSLLKKRTGLIEREYMEIEYAGGDKVYVPLTELGRITKYLGESDPELTKLSGKEWEKAISKTDEEIEKIAEDILETDARRKLTTRIPFGKFPEEEEKFLGAFQYTHTADQLSVIREIHEDMEGEHPMDRLISGDVGFGKTEVAMHAIYKAVLSGMQVAVVSPLLILAEEHRDTFGERLGAFGVKVASLTRMTKPREVKDILERIRKGDIDVVVGTHRLFSEDVRFRRLGLLVIDEEHRFGVTHKEAIKKMKAHVDILSLSATPIPRSLNLALSGLKKISLLTTPPKAKKPIETIITRWDESVIRDAIKKELARGGQVIILHNRIRALPMIEKELKDMFKNEERSMKHEEYSKGVRGEGIVPNSPLIKGGGRNYDSEKVSDEYQCSLHPNRKDAEVSTDTETVGLNCSLPPNRGDTGGFGFQSDIEWFDPEKHIPYIPDFDADICKERGLIYGGNHLPYNPNLVERAKEMRKNMTKGEKGMWFQILSQFPHIKFLKQRPIDHYIVDFYSSEYRLVIEVDGDSHFESESSREYDRERDAVLTDIYHLHILRFTNDEVLHNQEGVYEVISQKIESIKNHPSNGTNSSASFVGTSPVGTDPSASFVGTSPVRGGYGGLVPKSPLIKGGRGDLVQSLRDSSLPKHLRIATTHGQMKPDEIEDRVYDFKHGKYDILLTTTVIENGVNFLGANTIIVSDAEEFGLAQLHQIRGRVGRRDVGGICYLMYRKYELSSEERERLMILAENSALGSGYEIAMRDMQMRGTGDILGWRQSGKSKEVGISLYFQLLEEKIDLMKNGKKHDTLTKIDLELSYVIPTEYFDSEADKLSFFRDIESIETLEDLENAEKTFQTDDAPESMNNLFLMMKTSILLSQYGVIRLSKMGINYHFDFRPDTTPQMIRGFLERFDQDRDMILLSVTKVKVDGAKWKSVREFLISLVAERSPIDKIR